MNLLTVIIFLLIFSLLVLVHEAGHFWAARKAGVKVEEFGLGLPPRIMGRRRHGTLWSINLIPFGGFVRLKGEDGGHPQDKDSMLHKNYGQRLLIITGGVLMNFVLAYVLLAVGFWAGMPPLAADLQKLSGSKFDSKVVVLDLVKGSPAEKAGIKSGDVLISVDKQPITTVAQLQNWVADKSKTKVMVDRQGKSLSLAVPTMVQDNKHVLGVLVEENISQVKYVWWRVPYLAALDLLLLLRQIGAALVGFVIHLFVTASIGNSVAGPVGIARITSEAVKLGWTYTLQLIIFLSVNLGLINIVPFPALDGGRLVFILLEMMRGGRRVSKEWENAIHSLGFVLLLALIFAVTYRDVVNLFHSV